MIRSGPLAALVGAGLLLAITTVSAAPYDRLVDALRHDDAYKVRMKAIRVIAKRVRGSGKPAPASVIEAIGAAARNDDSYLVRGMACVALGRLMDPRGRGALEAAKRDDEAFVRAQAESALERLEPKAPAAAGDLLLVATQVRDDVALPAPLQESLLGLLESELTRQAQRYRVAREGEGPGYQLTGTVSRFDAAPVSESEVKLTLEVKLTVATWPGRHLRHVMSAKASATVPASRNRLSLQRKLLAAALKKTVADALQEIGGT